MIRISTCLIIMHALYIIFTFMHLADVFIQSGLLCVHTAGGQSIKIQRNAVERFVDALT